MDEMTNEEKAQKFNEIQAYLWTAAVRGNVAQSAFSAALIRLLRIPGPDGEDPEDA
jgi:hypothetical protein